MWEPYDIRLCYSPSLNRFIDDDWCVIHDINSLLDPWQIQNWLVYDRHNGRYQLVPAKNGKVLKLVYLTDEEEDDVFDVLSYQDSYGVKTDRPTY